MDQLQVNFIRNSTNTGELAYWYYKSGESDNKNKAILMINGFMSNSKNSSKVNFILSYSKLNNLNFLSFDHYGHGCSKGSISDKDLKFKQFIGDLKLIVDLLKIRFGIRDLIIVGSSFANWILLCALDYIQSQLHIIGWAGIGSSWNFGCNWMEEVEQLGLTNESIYNRPSKHDASGYYPISINLIKSMINYELKLPLKFNFSTYLIHGDLDEDVPLKIFLKNIEFIKCNKLRILIIEGGDHRLSSKEALKSLEFSLNQLIKLKN